MSISTKLLWAKLLRLDVLAVLAAVVLGTVFTKSVHETGHVPAALACGAKIHRICVMPCIQLYPKLKKGPPCRVMSVSYAEPDHLWQRGLVAFTGTGATTLAAYILLILIWRLPLPAWGRASLAAIALLLAWDMFLYSVLPLLGLRRFLFFGSPDAEPVHGMELMGVPKVGFLIGLALSFAVFHALLVWVLRTKPTS